MRGVSKPSMSLKPLEAIDVGASFGLLVRINNIVSESVLRFQDYPTQAMATRRVSNYLCHNQLNLHNSAKLYAENNSSISRFKSSSQNLCACTLLLVENQRCIVDHGIVKVMLYFK